MYDSEFVRKSKRRKVVAVITGISSITVAVLIIISFLGKYVGTFTVKLENGSIKLALQEYTGNGETEDPLEEDNYSELSTFLRVNALPRMHETTYSHLQFLGDDQINNGSTGWDLGANYDNEGTMTSIDFFKFTFYVRNLGNSSANYSVNLRITESRPSDDGRYLEDTLRVMLYENYRESTDNQKRIFAKKSATSHIDENGEVSFNEAISYDEEYAAKKHLPFYGYAEEFESSTMITSYKVENFLGGEVMKYTLVYWLEGYDPQSKYELEAPQNALIKLGVEIDAYEDESKN